MMMMMIIIIIICSNRISRKISFTNSSPRYYLPIQNLFQSGREAGPHYQTTFLRVSKFKNHTAGGIRINGEGEQHDLF